MHVLHAVLLGVRFRNLKDIYADFVAAFAGFLLGHSTLLFDCLRFIIDANIGMRETLLGLLLDLPKLRPMIFNANLLMKLNNKISQRNWTQNVWGLWREIEKEFHGVVQLILPNHVLMRAFDTEMNFIPVNIFNKFEWKLASIGNLSNTKYNEPIETATVSMYDLISVQLAMPSIRSEMRLKKLHCADFIVADEVIVGKIQTDGFRYNNGRSDILTTFTNCSVVGGEITPNCSDIIALSSAEETGYNLALHSQQFSTELSIIQKCGVLDPLTGNVVFPYLVCCEDTKSLQLRMGMDSANSEYKYLLNNQPDDVCQQWETQIVTLRPVISAIYSVKFSAKMTMI